MMLKICFLIVGIVFVVYILVGCSLTNAVEKRISDAILPSKYKKYADIHQDSISYEGNTMVKFKMMRGAFVNQKNELIVGENRNQTIRWYRKSFRWILWRLSYGF